MKNETDSVVTVDVKMFNSVDDNALHKMVIKLMLSEKVTEIKFSNVPLGFWADLDIATKFWRWMWCNPDYVNLAKGISWDLWFWYVQNRGDTVTFESLTPIIAKISDKRIRKLITADLIDSKSIGDRIDLETSYKAELVEKYKLSEIN